MFKAELIYLLVTYKYVIMVPLAFVEGHVISLIAGFLSQTGQLNPFISGICIASGNVIGDIVLYWLGYTKGERFVQKWGKYISLDDERIARGKEIFHKHKSKILFFSKVTNGFGLAIAILFTAGIMRIKFSTYLFWNVVGEFVWTSSLITVGYFLGNVYTAVDNVIFRTGIVMLCLVVFFVSFLFIKRFIGTKFNT